MPAQKPKPSAPSAAPSAASSAKALRPVDDVAAEVLASVKPITGTQIQPIAVAYGRYLAEDLLAPVAVPPADNSAMDGYAFCHDDIKAGVWLPVSDRIPAGQQGKPLAPGTLARIFTGAEIPEGADTVVMQEDTEAKDGQVRLRELPAKGASVRPKGQDIAEGELALAEGSCLMPQALALAASLGVSEVNVYDRPKVAILSTGDELIEAGQPEVPGKIYNSNRHALAGSLKQLGMLPIILDTVRDRPEAIESSLTKASGYADVIITSGGVSVGDADHVRAVVQKLGSIDIWKLAIKPGKPFAYGQVNGTPIFGLPGNPVSSFVTFHILVKPYLIAMAGGTPADQTYLGLADFPFTAGNRREYLRVQASMEGDQVKLQCFPNQSSGVMTSIVWGNALAQIEPGQKVSPGTPLKFHPY